MRWVLICLLACACANFSVSPASGPEAEGLHFFLPKPYVLLWWERSMTVRSGAPVLGVVPRFEILYLPDRSERYVLSQSSFLARGDFAYVLRDGWRLESVNASLDATELLRSLGDVGASATERALAQAAPLPDADQPLPPPSLYELVWDDEAETYRFTRVPLELPAPP